MKLSLSIGIALFTIALGSSAQAACTVQHHQGEYGVSLFIAHDWFDKYNPTEDPTDASDRTLVLENGTVLQPTGRIDNSQVYVTSDSFIEVSDPTGTVGWVFEDDLQCTR